jgi:hypothetical protein
MGQLTMLGESDSIFADRDVGFEDILQKGKLGGRPAILSYLDVRIKQLGREVEITPSVGLERPRLLLAVRAMIEARKVALTLR